MMATKIKASAARMINRVSMIGFLGLFAFFLISSESEKAKN
jgi:hypothetical protein